MSSLVTENSQSALSSEKVENIIEQMRNSLRGRVLEAFLFGSVADLNFSADSDIDLILIKDEVDQVFTKRSFEFIDLFEIFPRIDILVYSPQEFKSQLADSDLGFWKSVRLSMKKIL